MNRNTAVGIATSCAVACVLGLGGVASAWGDGKDVPPTTATPDYERAGMPVEEWEQQSRAGEVAGAIDSLVDPTESGRPARPDMRGYLLVRLESVAHRVDLFWKGAIPADVQAIIDAHPEVEVRIHSAAYSEVDFMDAQDGLVAIVEEAAAKAGRRARLICIQHVGNRDGFEIVLFDSDRVVSVSAIRRDFAASNRLDIPIQVKYSKHMLTLAGFSA